CDRQESNLRRPALQASALPAELRSRACAYGHARIASNESCPSHSSTLRPWITGCRSQTQPMSYVGERWSPALTVTFRNQRRCDCHLSVRCDCGSTQGGLSLSDGASKLQLACFKLSITDSLVRLAISRFRHKKR